MCHCKKNEQCNQKWSFFQTRNIDCAKKREASRPAELPGMVHVGPSFDVALVRVVDGGGSGVRSSEDENEAVEAHCRGVFVI